MALFSSSSLSTSSIWTSGESGVASIPLAHGIEGPAGLEHNVGADPRALFDVLVVTWNNRN